jgi:hypothetical protein
MPLYQIDNCVDSGKLCTWGWIILKVDLMVFLRMIEHPNLSPYEILVTIANRRCCFAVRIWIQLQLCTIDVVVSVELVFNEGTLGGPKRVSEWDLRFTWWDEWEWARRKSKKCGEYDEQVQAHTRFKICLFVFLLLSFWKSWLMASWIAACLILGVGFCNIYLIFLHTKSLKSSYRWTF